MKRALIISMLAILSLPALSAPSDFLFTPNKKNQDLGSAVSALKDREIAFLTYITDGVVRDGGDSQYQLQDNFHLPIDERKKQTQIKAVRVVHGEYALWMNHKTDARTAYGAFLKSYNVDRFVKEVTPFYQHRPQGNNVESKIYFPCGIVKTFESLRSLPSSDFATTLNASAFLEEKVNTYFKNYILDQKSLVYEQAVHFQTEPKVENESMAKAIQKNGLTPLGAVTQTLFNFNQFIRWGEIRFNFFVSPANPNKTLIYIESRLAMRADFMFIGPDKKGSYGNSEMGILLQAPLEDYLMGSVPFFKKELGQINFFGYDLNPKINVGAVNISDLLEAFEALVGNEAFRPTAECQSAQGPSILLGIPKFQQSYIEGFAKLYERL